MARFASTENFGGADRACQGKWSSLWKAGVGAFVPSHRSDIYVRHARTVSRN